MFTSDRDGDYDIWTMRADGSRLRKLTRNRIEDRCPSWSPNGRWIAFTRRNVYPPDLLVMRADGSGLRRVLKLRGTDSCPAWSPDGRRLVFVRMDNTLPTPVHAVYTVAANGSALRRLTPLNEAWENADWGRNGRIVFESTYAIEGRINIWSMRPDGSDRRRLTEAPTESHLHPRWSPDGRRIVFTNNRNGDEELYVMNADGSGMKAITDNGLNDWDPGWSPDGRKLVFARRPEARLRPDGGQPAARDLHRERRPLRRAATHALAPLRQRARLDPTLVPAHSC